MYMFVTCIYTGTHTWTCGLPHAACCAYLNAVVADAAVGAARWSVELARLTPLHLDLRSVDVNDLVERLSKVILLVRILCEGVRV